MSATPNRTANPCAIEPRLVDFARYGGTGVWRTVYSPEWVAAAETYARWGCEAGLEVRQDAAGNVWARLTGSEGGKTIVAGSHIDTQRPGEIRLLTAASRRLAY